MSVQINVTNPGFITFDTGTINGIRFYKASTYYGTGTHTVQVNAVTGSDKFPMSAEQTHGTGTYNTVGYRSVDTYSFGPSSCSFEIDVKPKKNNSIRIK